MQQKEAAWKHKSQIHKRIKTGEIDPSAYNQVYVVDPKKTFVVQPSKGELDYKMAWKNPAKFYDKVLKEDVVTHKVTKRSRKVQSKKPAGDGELPLVKHKRKQLSVHSQSTRRDLGQV